jgi:hypothetical protein
MKYRCVAKNRMWISIFLLLTTSSYGIEGIPDVQLGYASIHCQQNMLKSMRNYHEMMKAHKEVMNTYRQTLEKKMSESQKNKFKRNEAIFLRGYFCNRFDVAGAPITEEKLRFFEKGMLMAEREDKNFYKKKETMQLLLKCNKEFFMKCAEVYGKSYTACKDYENHTVEFEGCFNKKKVSNTYYKQMLNQYLPTYKASGVLISIMQMYNVIK